MPQVRLGDRAAGQPPPADGGTDRAERRAPAEHEDLRLAVRIVDLERPDVGGYAVNLRLAQPHHLGVVIRVIGDRAGHVGLLDAADPVLEARSSGNGPGPGESLRIALEWEELGLVTGAAPFVRAGEREFVPQLVQVSDLGAAPGPRPVPPVPAGQA